MVAFCWVWFMYKLYLGLRADWLVTGSALSSINYCTIFTARHKAIFAITVYATVYAKAYPSVHASHSGIVSKRGNAERCGLHRRVAQCL